MPDQLLHAFRVKLLELLNARDAIHQVPGGDLHIAFCRPGLPVAAAALDFSLRDAASARAAADFARLADNVPPVSGPWSGGGPLLSRVYEDVLKETVLAQDELTAREAEKLEVSRNLLVQRRVVAIPGVGEMEKLQETGRYALYKQLAAFYDRVLLKYNNLRITAKYSTHPKDQELWTANQAIYESQIRRWYNDWITRGSKNDIEEAIQFIDQVTGRDPGLRWRTMKSDLEIAKRGDPRGQTYYDTGMAGNPLRSDGNDGWWKMTVRTEEAANIESRSPQAVQIGRDDELDGVRDQLAAREMEVELFRAEITRPWFDTSVFSSRAWKWAPSSGISRSLADGCWPPAQETLLPVFSAGLLFARNLQLSGTSFRKPSSGAAGPFSLGGARFEAERISAPGLQIIAFLCRKVPRSPFPDPSLTWLA